MSTITAKKQLSSSLAQVIGGIEANPAAAEATFGVTSQLVSGFKAQVEARNFTFTVDEPENLGGTNQAPNPIEYVLGGLAACQEITVKAHAAQLGIDVESVEVEAEGDIDLHGFLNLSDERPGFKQVTYRTIIRSNEKDADKLNKLKEIANNNCPVLDIFKNETPVSGDVQFLNE